MQKTRVWSLGQEDPMEKETATHSCILAWEIPWIEEPGGRQSVGLQKSRTWLKQLTTNPRWQHYPSAHLWIAGKKVFFFFRKKKREREKDCSFLWFLGLSASLGICSGYLKSTLLILVPTSTCVNIQILSPCPTRGEVITCDPEVTCWRSYSGRVGDLSQSIRLIPPSLWHVYM